MSRQPARKVVDAVSAEFRELEIPLRDEPADGPIGWPGYREAREAASSRTGEAESVVCGTAKIGEAEAVLIAFEFGYLGGSLGQRTGDRIEAAFTHARERRLPVVSLIATGGSRMQQGMRALTQLQRLARVGALDGHLPAEIRSKVDGSGVRTNRISARLLHHAGEGVLYAPAMELGAALLVELGVLEKRADSVAAVAHLEQAVRLAPEPAACARAATELGWGHILTDA